MTFLDVRDHVPPGSLVVLVVCIVPGCSTLTVAFGGGMAMCSGCCRRAIAVDAALARAKGGGA